MDFLNHQGAEDQQVIITPRISLAAEILSGQFLGLQAGSHRPFEDQQSFLQCVQITPVGIVSNDGRFRV